MSGHDGFFSLGQAIAGGDPRPGEAAFLEGLDVGSRVRARNASTESALAQARIRRDEARSREEFRLLGPDAIDPTSKLSQLAGFDPGQATGAALERQEFENRAIIAAEEDQAIRNRAAQAVQGTVADPFQIEGGLFADTFATDPQLQVAPTGAASIEANKALAQKRVADAKLADKKRTNPELFKSSGKLDPSSDIPLSEQILGGDEGRTVIPGDFNPEEAFGVESFLKGGANAVADFFGGGTPFVDQAQANNILGEVSARIKLSLLADVFRPNNRVLTILETYAEDPQQLFRGDVLARQNLTTTRVAMERQLLRTKNKLDSPLELTPTLQGKLQDNLFSLLDTVSDLQAVENSFQRTEGESPFSSAPPLSDAADDDGMAIGATQQLPGGGTITRVR